MLMQGLDLPTPRLCTSSELLPVMEQPSSPPPPVELYNFYEPVDRYGQARVRGRAPLISTAVLASSMPPPSFAPPVATPPVSTTLSTITAPSPPYHHPPPSPSTTTAAVPTTSGVTGSTSPHEETASCNRGHSHHHTKDNPVAARERADKGTP